MLSIPHGYSRREWLQIGGLGAFGLTLPKLLEARASSPTQRKTKSVIMLFLLGAPPQQETWDPKPDAPLEIRGDHKLIHTATPGLMIGETMVKTAKLTNKIAIMRAAQTNDNAHSSSGYFMTTGFAHAPMQVENAKPGAPNDWPSTGAIVRRLLPSTNGMPTAVTLPEQAENDGNKTWPGQDAGFLGRAYDPWLLHCDPNQNDFQIPGLSLPSEISRERFELRQTLKNRMDQHFERIEESSADSPHASRYQNAINMIASSQARKAFDLNAEDPKLRDRYGRTRFGQSCLLARRLVEAGVPLVRVNWTRVPKAMNNGTWDTHSKNSAGVKEIMPIADAAFSTLIEDLSDRGLLEDTMVIWTGEFGRTPKINGNGGRDHWGKVFSIAMAGGGVRGGTIYGSSDASAAYPKDGLVRPQDFTATLFHALGIPPDSEVRDTLGRPLAISRGEVVKQIL